MAVEKGVKMFSQLHCLHILTSGLLTPPKKEIRAGKLLVDPGHLQEGLVGGHPHHHYIKACRRRPMVDRVLKKTHVLLMTMPKNFQVMLPCPLTHLVYSIFKIFRVPMPRSTDNP
jgi:hypothetical protein